MAVRNHLAFFEQQLALVERGFTAARDRADYHVAVVNANEVFKARVMCGLILWRRGEDPRGALRAAVGGLGEAADALTALRGAPPNADELHYQQAHIIAWLVGTPFAAPVPPRMAVPPDVELDYLLGDALDDRLDRARWTQLLGRVRSPRRTALLGETYAVYGTLLEGVASDPVRASELVTQAEALYARRAKDSYFAGGTPTNGGGPDNALVVDYRLGAVLRRAGLPGGGVHAWRWD